MLRTMGKKFSFKVIVPKIKKLWNLSQDYDIIDIDKGYLVTRIYSCTDYVRVLEGEPCMVIGHYLMITKWRPNFTPSESTTMSMFMGQIPSTSPRNVFGANSERNGKQYRKDSEG